MHAGTGEERTEGTISLLPIEQLPQLPQINLTWLIRCRKKKSKQTNKRKKPQNPALLKLDACTIHALLGNLQHPDIATTWVPSLQREVNTHQWEKEYSFSPAGMWYKTAALLPYLAGKLPVLLWKNTPWAYVNSFSITALGPLSEPCLNQAIMPPHHFILKLAEPCGVRAKTCGGIAQTAFWNVVRAAVALGFL